MKNDRPFNIAMKIVGMRGDTEAYRDAVSAIARAIRAEVKRAVKPFREAIDACDWSFSRVQTEEVHDKIQKAMDTDPFKD